LTHAASAVRNGHSEAVHKRSSAHSFHGSISSQTAIVEEFSEVHIHNPA
jgi:hypothetical protein